MARIHPLAEEQTQDDIKKAFENHITEYDARIGLFALEGATPREIAERSAGNLLDVPWIEAEDVAEAVVFLAADKARFVTGSQFVIDAGLLSR